MEINQLNSDQFSDMFGMTLGKDNDNTGFSRTETKEDGIFNITTTKTEAELEAERLTKEALAGDDKDKDKEKKVDANGNEIEEEENKEGEDGENKDGIFMHDEDKKKLGRKAKYDFSDATGYFEDRIKNGKFVQIEEEDDKGVKKVFIPKTPEDFDEFLELQINHKLEEKSKDLSDNWYKSLSPAWQAVARYAQQVSHPSEVIPFIEGVRNIDAISEINEKEPEGAEQIVRFRMKSAGDPQEIIDEQIAALKETNKLITTAERFKPLLVKNEQARLSVMKKEKEDEERNYLTMVNAYRTKAIEKIEAQVFGKQKLKDDEKALVYDMIAVPDAQEGGYAIYSEIDKLYETQDFDTLRDIALFLKKRDAFLGYVGKSVAETTANNLTKRLKVSTTTATGNQTDDDSDNTQRQVIRRTSTNPSSVFRRDK